MKYMITLLFMASYSLTLFGMINSHIDHLPADTLPSKITENAVLSPSSGLLTIEGSSVSKDGRQLLTLDNKSEDSFSATVLDIITGIDSANIGSGYIATYAKSYSVVQGYGGYMVINSNLGMPGLSIRAQDEDGLIRFLVGGTDFSNEKLQINNSGLIKIVEGDVFIEDVNKGIIMKSPNGQCWRYNPDNSGNLIGTSTNCPN